LTTDVIGSGCVSPPRSWTSVASAWLGIGTAPGALLMGSGLAARYHGPVPVLSVAVGMALILVMLWFQGHLGLLPPLGDGANLTQLTPCYFGSAMQRVLGGLIALGMMGWFGFNAGLGGAALAALLGIPSWAGTLILGLPILALSLRGMRSWNVLATLATISVLTLVVLVVARFGARAMPLTLTLGDPMQVVLDVAIMVGYIVVFAVRAPDFTAGLGTRKDLGICTLLLGVPMVAILLAGVDLEQGTGSADLVGVLAGPNGLALGNLLLTLAVIAPMLTILYSGGRGLDAATGVGDRAAIAAVAVVGLGLGMARFDLELGSWLGILAAILPSNLIPLSAESVWRRRGHVPSMIPAWLWMPGALVSLLLTLAKHPLALLAGLFVSGVVTVLHYLLKARRLASAPAA
jgi:cytosine permease